MSRYVRSLVFILALSGFALWISLPDTRWSNIPDYCEDYELFNTLEGIHLDINNDCEPDIALPARQSLGLDLVGGLRVLLRADLPPGQYTVEDLRQTANNVSRRIDALGVGEATIEVLAGSGRILVELPGVSDPEQAVNAIQQTALLEFVDFSGLRGQIGQFEGQRIITTEQLLIQQQRQSAAVAATPVEGAAESVEPEGLVHPVTRQPFETVMTGAGLQAAVAQYDPTSKQWFIQFELNSQGNAAFGPYTATHIQEPMAIVLDGIVLSAPIIQAELTTGGVIEGGFTEQTAKTLALQLRSGALPVPLSVESTEQVVATLEQETINLSIRAGIIGVITVLTFMLVYYRVPGLAADLALLVFILLNLAVFKLIPITLTLPAITGFLIGIGTAVDGNILIFERIKEELRG